MMPLAFKLFPWELFENSEILSKIFENLNFAIYKKGVLKLCQSNKTKDEIE